MAYLSRQGDHLNITKFLCDFLGVMPGANSDDQSQAHDQP